MRQPGPYHWLASLALGAVLLSSCAVHPAPPSLTEADLHDAVAMDMLGKVPTKVDIVRRFADPPETCVDLHHGQTSFGQFASSSNKLARILMRLGLRGGLTHWQRPGLTAYDPIDAGVERRLAGVSAAAILKAAGARQAEVADKPWPERCARRYWLAAPLYQGDFAFVARGTAYGGLSGSSAILAFEYRDGRWRVVGVHDTKIG